MKREEVPHRRTGHREESARVLAALASLPYPIARDEAAQRVRDTRIEVAGQEVSLSRLVEAIPMESLRSPGEAADQIDRRWGEVADQLQHE